VTQLIILEHTFIAHGTKARLLPRVEVDDRGYAYFDDEWSRWCCVWRDAYSDAETRDWVRHAPVAKRTEAYALASRGLEHVDLVPGTRHEVRLLLTAYVLARLGVMEPGKPGPVASMLQTRGDVS